MALKKTLFEMRSAGYDIAADEVDFTRQCIVEHPSVDPVWFGTTAAGTAGQAKTLTITNLRADYPRNAVYGVAGSAGMGGTFSVTGKDQFGVSQTETVAIGTAANGGTVAGTKIWSQISAGTFTYDTNSVGSGSARLGVAIGTSTTLQHWFGLPDKIGAVADVKFLNWVNNGTQTTFNGGTISSTYVNTNSGTPANAFKGSAVVAITDKFFVTYKSSYSAEENQNNL